MIGDSIDRIDGRLKVTGGARYSAEWPIDGLAYACLAQSSIARGMVAAMDTSEAASSPGVLLVMTADNAPALAEHGRAAVNPPAGRELSLLQDRAVRYNGEPIAVVVAATFEQATHAASLVRVTYHADPPLVDMTAALPTAQPYRQKILGTIEPSSHRGDPDAALAGAAARVEAVYTTPLETHNALEPHATIATWEGDRLTLYDSTQFVYGVRRFVAKTFGLPDDHVTVISKFAGGAFGSKGSAWSHVVLAAMAARQVNRPVKLVLTRRQMFGLVGARPYTVQQVAVGAAMDGRLSAIRQHVTSSTSTFEDWVESASLQTRMLYDVPNVVTTQNLVRLNVGTPTFNRGPGESSGTFALESALDELAAALKIDPVELRLKNYAESDPETGHPWSSKSLRQCYAQGAERIGWARRDPKPRSMRDGDQLIGLGMATATYPARRMPASARARLMADGTVTIQAATHELGTGTYTVMTQVAADALGIPVDRVRFELGDSRLPENPISAGSMTASSTGPAVDAAARALRRQLVSMGVDPADDEGCRALVAKNGEPVEATGRAQPGREAEEYSMHSFGAVFAEVGVDPDLGQIRVRRVVGAYGAGRILNGKTARSQLVGGLVYGLAMALFEHTLIDPRTGRYVNADLAEYLVPVNADVPDIDVLFVEEADAHVNPLGVKGIGEIGTTGVTAAVANAVYHATGVRVRDLPITLDKLLERPGA